MIIFTVLFQLCLAFLSYFIPKKSNLILCGAGLDDAFRGNPKYLYLYMVKNNTDFTPCWSTTSKELYQELKEKNHPVIYRKSLKGFWMIMRAKFIVIEKSALDSTYTHHAFGRFNFLQTWHGITIKKLGSHALEDRKGTPGYTILSNGILLPLLKKFKLLSMMKFKLVLSSTDNQVELLKEIFWNDNVFTLGYPRNDVFFNPDLIYVDHKAQLEIDCYEKVILYAPTHRDMDKGISPFTTDFLTELNSLMAEKNQLFLVKKHPLLDQIDIPQGLSHIKDISNEVRDIHEILIYTDLLISDYSSTPNDFLLTNKPCIYYNFDFENYQKQCRGFYYDYYTILSGPFAKNQNELFSLLNSVDEWSQSEDYRKKLKTQKDFFYTYTDGNSCERFLAHLSKIG